VTGPISFGSSVAVENNTHQPELAHDEKVVALMNVTEVRVFPVKKEDDKLKAFATITLDSCFVIRDLKVIHGNSGLFIAMPSRKKKDGTYADIAHPLNRETREMIEQAVFDEYRRQVDGDIPEARVIGAKSSLHPALEADPEDYFTGESNA